MNFRASQPWAVAVLGLALAGAGCESMSAPAAPEEAPQVQEKKRLVRSMKELHKDLLDGGLQIQRAVSAMDDFTRTADLKKAYAMFNDSVTELKQAADHARQRGAEMREYREDYLARWEEEVSTMQNPQIKEGLEERRHRIREKFDQITQQADDVRAAYPPFVSTLEEIQKALKLDLSPSSVQAIKPGIDQAKQQADTLSKKLDTLATEVEKLQGSLAPPVIPAKQQPLDANPPAGNR